MIVAILPGFARLAPQYAHWTGLLPAEVRVLDLPGHGPTAPPLGEPSLPRLAAYYAEAIPPGAVVVGESLGGLIALELAATGHPAIAVEPPLSMAKQWIMHRLLPGVVADHAVDAPWMADFVLRLFGVAAGEPPRSLNYWPLLDRAKAPVHVIAAVGIPLWPMRRMDLTVENTPSVLDEVDAYLLERRPDIGFHRIAGPHTLLTERVEACRALLTRLLGELAL
jgi:pimeloyl-ACP methyl ester carboxylesterase